MEVRALVIRQLRISSAPNHSDNKANLIPGEDSFTLTDLPENTSIGVILPHTDVSGVPSLVSSPLSKLWGDKPTLNSEIEC